MPGGSSFSLWWAALLTGIVVLPFAIPPSMATEVVIYGIVAVAANLLIGYAGLYSFGQAAFFGVGGYMTANLLLHLDLPVLPALALGAVVSGLVAALVGFVCVRRTGIYFIMLTFAFNQMIFYIAYQWRDATGGEDGLSGVPRPDVLGVDIGAPIAYYAFAALVFVLCFWAMGRIVASPFGRIVVATRENPRRAASVGFDVTRAQTAIFAMSGAFTGLAGGLYAMLYGLMPIDAVNWINSGNIVFMVLIGGTGNLFGPAAGAVIFIILQDVLSVVWARWPLLFGAVVIAVVLYFQGGFVELFHRLGRCAAARRKARAR